MAATASSTLAVGVPGTSFTPLRSRLPFPVRTTARLHLISPSHNPITVRNKTCPILRAIPRPPRRSTFISCQQAQNQVVEEESEEDDGSEKADEEPKPSLSVLLQSFREALANEDEAEIRELEQDILAIESEKNALSQQVEMLTDDLSKAKERFMRLNADFDNFRKRSDKERLNLASNIQGEIIESLLPMVDNFERAKTQIKTQTEGEEKIDKSYQGIYKQFVEIMKNLQVKPVDTVGVHFDPMIHEAIMREESNEFEEGKVIEEFRRGFILGEKLLRPAMVKVSAGPGPAKAADVVVESGTEAGEDPVESAENIQQDKEDGSDLSNQSSQSIETEN